MNKTAASDEADGITARDTLHVSTDIILKGVPLIDKKKKRKTTVFGTTNSTTTQDSLDTFADTILKGPTCVKVDIVLLGHERQVD